MLPHRQQTVKGFKKTTRSEQCLCIMLEFVILLTDFCTASLLWLWQIQNFKIAQLLLLWAWAMLNMTANQTPKWQLRMALPLKFVTR